ncbi:hypothetical protein EDB83DRAFT_2404557 [Lactarius deliciosus]|nr:hypothetical protein EDB83DRAFT_2404557 [Lactarius deliciosus]
MCEKRDTSQVIDPHFMMASSYMPPFTPLPPGSTAFPMPCVESSYLYAGPAQGYGHHPRTPSPRALQSQDASHLQHPHAYHGPPPPSFPQAPSFPTAIPTPSVANSTLSAAGPAQGYGHPRTPSPRTPSSHLPSQDAFPPPAYLPASRYIPESGHPHPTSQTSQVWTTHAPTTHSGPPSPTHRNVTIHNPQLHDTRVPPQAGLHPTYAPQPLKYDSYHGEYQDNHDNSAMHSGGATPKGPPDRPVAGIQDTQNGPSLGFWEWIRRPLSAVNRSRNQTPAPPATASQQATRCRFPGCHNDIPSDVAARLDGFCCNSHRDRSSGTLS